MSAERRLSDVSCPFCGRRDTMEFAHHGRFLAVECAAVKGGCGARGPEAVRHGEAVQLWNQRPAVRKKRSGADERMLADVLIAFLQEWKSS